MQHIMEFCNNFDFEIEKIVNTIRSRDIRKLYIQLPEGFQRCIRFIIDRIKQLLDRDVEIVVSANPSYGSCLIDEYGAKSINADLIVHFGHTPYPHYTHDIEVLFIPVEYTGVDKSRLLKVVKDLCSEKQGRLCIAASPQHISIARFICNTIEKCECEYKGVAMGCYPVAHENCDTFIIISGGKFHCIAQALSGYSRNIANTPSKILCLDPYTYSLWDPVKDVEKIIKIRMWKIYQAIDAKRWLIVDGFYGQHRKALLTQLIKLLKSNNKEYYILKALKLDRETLINLEADKNFDVIVIASCPYLAFDFKDFSKPILTVGEALAILHGNLNRYVYPW